MLAVEGITGAAINHTRNGRRRDHETGIRRGARLSANQRLHEYTLSVRTTEQRNNQGTLFSSMDSKTGLQETQARQVLRAATGPSDVEDCYPKCVHLFGLWTLDSHLYLRLRTANHNPRSPFAVCCLTAF